MKKAYSIVGLVLLVSAAANVLADSYTETNKKIIYLTPSGFGPEGKEEKFAGIKLDTKESLAAVCAWDVIAFDPSTDAGKKTFKDLNVLVGSKTPLKSITFSKDKEGDCYLDKYEK